MWYMLRSLSDPHDKSLMKVPRGSDYGKKRGFIEELVNNTVDLVLC